MRSSSRPSRKPLIKSLRWPLGVSLLGYRMTAGYHKGFLISVVWNEVKSSGGRLCLCGGIDYFPGLLDVKDGAWRWIVDGWIDWKCRWVQLLYSHAIHWCWPWIVKAVWIWIFSTQQHAKWALGCRRSCRNNRSESSISRKTCKCLVKSTGEASQANKKKDEMELVTATWLLQKDN